MEAQNEEDFRAQVSPFGGGMDWLEVRLPQLVTFRPRVTEAIAAYRDGGRSPFRTSPNYAAVVDLRPFDIADAFLHLSKKGRGEQTHKVQMIGTGQFSMREHLAHLESIVDTDLLALQPMRTDLTVDLPAITVDWVLNHAAVEKKRFIAELGKAERAASVDYMTLGRRHVETIYCGKRPNCFRVYDKIAERMAAWAREFRGWHPPEPRFPDWCKRMAGDDLESVRAHFLIALDAWERKVAAKGPKPSFREFCGMNESDVLTRFERQIGAQQVGKIAGRDKRPLFGSLRDLRANLAEFNPFEAVSFMAGQREPALPDGSNYSGVVYMAGLEFRRRVLADGRQRAEAWVHSIANGHGKKLLRDLAPFYPSSTDGAGVSSSELYERYRDAITKQLAA
jgi:hypothetical protein